MLAPVSLERCGCVMSAFEKLALETICVHWSLLHATKVLVLYF